MTSQPNFHQIPIPKGMPVARATPTPMIQMPTGMAEMPLFDKSDPKERQIQQYFNMQARVFDLSNADDVRDYQAVWQRHIDKLGYVFDSMVNFLPEKATYIALLRWADYEYKLPARQD